MVSCFNTLWIYVKKNEKILASKYGTSSRELCRLLTNTNVIIDIGFFHSEEKFVSAKNGFTPVQKYEIEWSSDVEVLKFKTDNGKLIALKNKLYSGVFITYKIGDFLDQIEAEVVEVNLVEKMLMIVLGIVGVSVVAVLACLSLQLASKGEALMSKMTF